jgi:plastocyanin
MRITSIHPVRTGLRVGLAVGALALLTAACGSGGGGSPSSGQQPTPAASGQVQGTKVTATLTEFHIALSQSTFAPGTYTFVATDAGQATHALEINGPGVDGKATSDVSPGQSANLTVTLQAGSYDVFCPVGNHKAMGMDLTVKVAAGAGGGASPTTSAMPSMTGSSPTTGGGGYGNGY